jgi:hypothetical protein
VSKLRDEALELGIASIDPSGPMLPFVLAMGTDGKLIHLTLVVDRSDQALEVGRRMVLERAKEIAEYVLVVDSYLRIDGVRHDVLLVESGAANAPTARVTAYRYRHAADTAVVEGAPIDFEQRPTALLPLDPHLLDWGSITPDFYNDEQNHAVHVVSHALDVPAEVARTIRFVRGRARWFARHLPAGAKQSVFVEDRGRELTEATRDTLLHGFGDALAVRYLSELDAD